MLTKAFLGHGTFFYLAAPTLAKFNDNAEALADAMKRAGMGHAWVRLHDHQLTPEPEQPTRRLIDTLRDAGIAVAGWGFVRGWDPAEEARVAAQLVGKYGLAHYVADIEQDEHSSRWTTDKIPTFLKRLREQLPAGAQIVVSSYPYIVSKHPELMKAAVPHADGFAPQIYWYDYPAAYMLEAGSLPPRPSHAYSASQHLHNPAIYADLCLDWWRATVGDKPLILTGQAYWENFSKEKAEIKLDRFLPEFTGWSRVVGVNWWHFGHKNNTADNGAMTTRMFDAIVQARISDKPLAQG
jgi:hypothetical protein